MLQRTQGLELCWGLSSASVPEISREGENIIIYPRVEKRGGQVYRSEWEVYVGGGGGGGGRLMRESEDWVGLGWVG